MEEKKTEGRGRGGRRGRESGSPSRQAEVSHIHHVDMYIIEYIGSIHPSFALPTLVLLISLPVPHLSLTCTVPKRVHPRRALPRI